MGGGVKKKKQADEISKYGRLPGSTHTQMEFPIDEVIFEASQLHSGYVKSSVKEVHLSKERDILGKHKKGWNSTALTGNKAGVVRFPDPCMKATNSRFMSIPEYEFNYRSEYIPRMEGPISTKPDRRRFGQVDQRDDNRVIKDSKFEQGWVNDKGERVYHTVQAISRKKGEAPLTALKDAEWDKPMWNVSTSTETLEDQIERERIFQTKEKKAAKSAVKKNAKITTTRMGLIHRHNAVAAAIREAKTEAREAPKLPDPPPPTIAAIRRSERQIRNYEHTGKWEMNPAEGRMMWSDTGSYDFDSRGDSVKVKTHGAWTFAAPN